MLLQSDRARRPPARERLRSFGVPSTGPPVARRGEHRRTVEFRPRHESANHSDKRSPCAATPARTRLALDPSLCGIRRESRILHAHAPRAIGQKRKLTSIVREIRYRGFGCLRRMLTCRQGPSSPHQISVPAREKPGTQAGAVRQAA